MFQARSLRRFGSQFFWLPEISSTLGCLRPLAVLMEWSSRIESETELSSMRSLLLRILLLLDAVILFLLGALLLARTRQVELAFHFTDLPAGVSYLIGLWGCVCLTMSFGYAVAAKNPIRHVIWVQVGIARGMLECLVGIIYLKQDIVTFQQAGLGIILAGLIALAYVVLYPRKPRIAMPETSAQPMP